MSAKSTYSWDGKKERSIFDIVTEEGVMRPKDIFSTVQKICKIVEDANKDAREPFDAILHPQLVMMKQDGTISLKRTRVPLYESELYSPPEYDRANTKKADALVYSLGMMMLFMATGYENKTKLDTQVEDKRLREVIECCTAFDPRARVQNIRDLSLLIKRKRRNTKKLVFGLLGVVILSIATGLSIHFFYRGRDKGEIEKKESGYRSGYATGYDVGFQDARGIGMVETPFTQERGNLPGNLTAAGGAFAARSKHEIFFIDRGSIYRMDPFSREIQLLAENAGAEALNYYDGWLYYASNKKIYRIDPTSMKSEIFCDTHSGLLYIIDGEFFLDTTRDHGYLYQVHAPSGTVKQLNSMTAYGCLDIVRKQLYFASPENDYNLYRCNLDGSNMELLNSDSCEWFCIYENRIYAYVASNRDADRKVLNDSASFLISMDLDGGNIKRYTNKPAYYINVTPAGIFYVAGNRKTLEWTSLDGRVHYSILTTKTGPFNIVGRWIFYQNEEDGGHLWRVRIDGSDNERVMP